MSPMQSRRDALLMLGAAFGQAACATRASATPPPGDLTWAPYRQSFNIDGAGGPMLGFLEPDDPLIPGELAAIRASGLTGCVLTLAPQGQFWLDDAAIARARANIEKWNGIATRYPEHLIAVRTSADLVRARTENKLGLIYTFQGVEPLGENVERVIEYRELGVRVMQITHNRRNLAGDGATEPGNAGLSNFWPSRHREAERREAGGRSRARLVAHDA